MLLFKAAFVAMLASWRWPAGSVSPARLSGPASAGDEFPCTRTFMYAGGEYVDDGRGAHVMRHQMYVERLQPVGGATQPLPVVLMHGMGMTGTNFLNKPDGGRGWASDFVRQGYEVFVADQPSRGRSAWQPDAPGDGAPAVVSAETVEDYFTAPRIKRRWPQAARHRQWPGSGVRGDAVFDRFFAAMVPFATNATATARNMQRAGASLVDAIGRPVVLVGHSQGGPFPVLVADARPALVAALILLEPAGPPFADGFFGGGPARAWGLTDVPLTYSPPVGDPAADLVRATRPAPDAEHLACTLQADRPPPRRLVHLAEKPILVVSAEASYHAQYDYCTVAFLRQAGCARTEHLELAAAGMRGNGHMMFLEKNSGVVQAALHRWIARVGG